MMEDFNDLGISVWSLQTGEWPTLTIGVKNRPSAKAVQADLANHRSAELTPKPYAALGGNPLGGER
jgi:hypothetical protein